MFWRKLSLGSPFNDLPGALSSSASNLPILSLPQKDDAYRLQANEPRPWLLINSIFHYARLLDTVWQSEKIYDQLVHMELLSPEGEVNTEPVERPNFGKNLMNRTAIIPQIKTKMVIDFLFWWVEETQRLKKLVAERDELQEIIHATPDATDERGVPAKLLLSRVKARIMIKPSERINNEDEQPLQMSTGSNAVDGLPPAYQR